MPVKNKSEAAQSRWTPSDPTDPNLPGPSVHGTFQARELEWVAIAFFIFIVESFILRKLPYKFVYETHLLLAFIYLL